MGQSFAVAAAIVTYGPGARAQPATSAQPANSAQPAASEEPPAGAPPGTNEQAVTPGAPAVSAAVPVAPPTPLSAPEEPSNQPEPPPPAPAESAQPGSFSTWRGAAARAGRVWGRQGPAARWTPGGIDPELAEWDDRNAAVGKLRALSFVSAQLFVWPYLASLLAGGIAGECKQSCGDVGRDLQWLTAPVVGPFIAAAVLGDRVDKDVSGLLIADGVLQTAGLAGFVGFWLLASHIDNQPWKSERRASFQLAPTVLPGGGGLGIIGSF